MRESASGAGRFYRPELDVVRLLAFVLVFLHHTVHPPTAVYLSLLPGHAVSFIESFFDACRFGLSLFFALSAFLICQLLLRERERIGTISIKQFYIRRILRIWPLYYLALALGVVFAFLPGENLSSIAVIGWFALFLGAWHDALFGWFHNPVFPLWSISVEEQFYLFAPWIVKYSSRRMLFGFCSILLLLSNTRLYFLSRASAPDYAVWADSIVQFECFAAGILLCLFLKGSLPKIALWQRLFLLAGTFGCWMVSAYWMHSCFYLTDNPGACALIAGYALEALGSALVLLAFLGIQPKLLPGWAIFLGRISFGLYVFHGFAHYLIGFIPISGFVHARISSFWLSHLLAITLKIGMKLGLTVLAAALSYRYFETPFLKMKKRHALIESQPIAGER